MYELVRASAGELPELVNKKLNEGWTLYGNPFYTGSRILVSWHPGGNYSDGYSEYTSEVAQAMTITEVSHA